MSKFAALPRFSVFFRVYLNRPSATLAAVSKAMSRKFILNGVDGVIYVADSDKARMRDNLFTLIDLVKNLRANRHQVEDFPIILQYNKRDLPDAAPLEYLRKTLNRFNAPDFEASAVTGVGVFESLKTAIDLVVKRVTKLV